MEDTRSFTDGVRSTRRDVMFSVCPHPAGGTNLAQGRYFLAGVGIPHPMAKIDTSQPGYVSPPPPARVGTTQIGQHMEYLIRCGRYASCVHAEGLSCCFRLLCEWANVNSIFAKTLQSNNVSLILEDSDLKSAHFTCMCNFLKCKRKLLKWLDKMVR